MFIDGVEYDKVDGWNVAEGELTSKEVDMLYTAGEVLAVDGDNEETVIADVGTEDTAIEVETIE
jgi:hypothetical protein